MSIQRLMTDNVFFEDDSGKRSGPYKTKFGSSKKIKVFDDKLVVKEGDVVIQSLPNGTEERFVITDTQFNSGLRKIKPFFTISIVKESTQQREERMVENTTFHINNSNVQVGDGNIQNIVNSFEQLVKEIDKSSSTSEQKEEAKGLVKTLISNPTVAAVLGAAVSGLLGIM
ncbi:hypothetical protein ACFL6N_02540 [Thermodesulfobacteriota bacterium]